MGFKLKVNGNIKAVVRTKEGLIRTICADGVTRCLTDDQYMEEEKKKRVKRNADVDSG